MVGKTLAHYEIASLIGKGGMGEVYQAKDQKLGRDVAIKVLPEEFAKDADRVARFQREAKMLASLNHPNIASIYGLEEANRTHFLVLVLIEGDTLADRIKGGPIPVEESLKLALQIAEALEAAHEKGVIHRDLKPANIKVTPDGKVKVLDFGLAKAFAGEQSDLNLSNSPTLSDMATQQGLILGTAAYMSPEQARGKPVDKRTDIWAFGCVLYEMLTGKAAFQGEDVTETLAAVVKSGVNLDLLPANIHPRVRELISHCLQKDQRKRYSGIADAQYEIEQVLADPSGVFAQPSLITKPRKKLRVGLVWVAAALVVGAIIAGAVVWKLKPIEPKRVVRFEYELPEDQRFGDLSERAFAVSPDGSQFVYKTEKGLYLRSIGALAARLIPGTGEYPQKPFFSPDGQWIGYVSGADGGLKKISINGGAPVPLTNDSSTGFLRWGADHTIVYSTGYSGNIMRISENGGSPQRLAKEDGGLIVAPHILPDGKNVLYTNAGAPYKVFVQSLESGKPKELLIGDTARYLPTGHLVYAVDNNLFAVAFDPVKLEIKSGPIPMVEGVLRASGAPQYAVSDSGTLIYMPGSSVSNQRTFVWVDRQGKEESIGVPPNIYYDYFKMSPDGTRVAMTITASGNQDIWIWDIARKTMTRFTFENGNDGDPVWTPDGKRILFDSAREGRESIFWKAADGSGKVEKLASVPDRDIWPYPLSSDGKTLILGEYGGENRYDIGMLSMEGDHTPKWLLKEKYGEYRANLSTDGKWLAYQSDESGSWEIYIRPFPDVDSGGRWQVSTNGGEFPLWSPNGKELFYRGPDSIVAVSVETKPTLKLGTPKNLFLNKYVGQFDITPDGKRFVMLKPLAASNEKPAAKGKIVVVLNWLEELKQRVPVE
jgi:serine/threonine protein kinase/Tol biopolymer transport system component